MIVSIFSQGTAYALTTALVEGLRWEASHGFDVTNDMKAAVSAHAALLVLAIIAAVVRP